jgi:hypothetical protein
LLFAFLLYTIQAADATTKAVIPPTVIIQDVVDDDDAANGCAIADELRCWFRGDMMVRSEWGYKLVRGYPIDIPFV